MHIVYVYVYMYIYIEREREILCKPHDTRRDVEERDPAAEHLELADVAIAVDEHLRSEHSNGLSYKINRLCRL